MSLTHRRDVESASLHVGQNYLMSLGLPMDAPDFCMQVLAKFSGVDLAHLIVFCSPNSDFAGLVSQLHAQFDCPVVGCTSAGEISNDGFVEDHVVLVGLPKRYFEARSVLIENLSNIDSIALNDKLIQDRRALTTANPDKPNGFSFLMIDGLSRCEDQLVGAISPSLAGFPLFGGSAGDGQRFKRSLVAFNGRVYDGAATLTFVVTNCDVSVFSYHHMLSGETRMVVTEARPDARIVCEINDEPAAAEFARLIGKDPNQLNKFIFAENPVTVRIGDDFHVRAIQRVNKDGHLVFFSAIDEGMVLTVAQPQDMTEHLEASLTSLVNGRANTDLLVCDCFLRRIEAQKSQSQHKINKVFKQYGVVGFSTYGEQIGPLHVNHTLTGVALFPPNERA